MKAPKKIDSEVTFQIVNIELVEFSIQDKTEDVKDFESQDLNNYLFEISLDQNADFENNLIAVKTLLIIKNADKTFEFASLTTRCYFRFNDLSLFVDKKDIMNVPDNIRDRIASISISTSRGILFSQLKPTYLKGAILPIIDVGVFNYTRVK